jgi:sugar lactone lactonase YvrE
MASIKKRPMVSIFMALLAAALGYVLLWPVPFNPVAGPPRAENPAGTGIFVKNNALAEATMVATGHGPEGTAVDAEGRLYTGLHDGRIIRITLPDGTIEELANTQGRPLGIEFDGNGDLIIADATKGLLSMAQDGTLSVLATDFEGERMKFVDDLAIGKDGVIYFSDASQRYEYGEDIKELFERRPSGRLIAYDPANGELTLLLDDLYFANGVALSQDETFVLVNETFEHRIMQYWLKGPKAGAAEVFAENLPGYIDNITEAEDGGFWLAVVAARRDDVDNLVDKPFLRKVVWRVTQATGGSLVTMHSYAVKLDKDGKLLKSLEDDSGHIYMMTSVLEHKGKLYLGSLLNDGIGIIDAP